MLLSSCSCIWITGTKQDALDYLPISTHFMSHARDGGVHVLWRCGEATFKAAALSEEYRKLMPLNFQGSTRL